MNHPLLYNTVETKNIDQCCSYPGATTETTTTEDVTTITTTTPAATTTTTVLSGIDSQSKSVSG